MSVNLLGYCETITYMAGPARRHHLVSKFYLRHFADENDMITTVFLPGDRSIVQNIGNASVQNNFYTGIGHDGQETDTAEQAFSLIETPAADAWEQIAAGVWPLPDTEREAVAGWIARNVIKIGIPGVGIPLAVVVNRYTTLLAGRHAQAVFRNEARVIELAESLSKRSQHPQLMLWVAWLVIMADQEIADDEALLIRHLVRLVRDQHQVVDTQLAHLVDVDPAEVWRRLDGESGDLSDILDVANRVATVDGAVNARERAIIFELQDRCGRV